ncbi:DNA-binding protein [candidate division KSB3 bacterium]|uniref:DNA-binding protein n=1 Tax=candidate division KSB3 bacterium TaxID=2044937 RepID=A0A2G6E293_9BACT|nr:MAG: DNA-binding protein [candidate division KSB3 bacterium]PIE28707.1 MAG: DNA-binding protein [candidate division KSB3 bacterium]
MVKLQRLQQIEEYVRRRNSVSLDDLCRHFDVSKNTIRRDMNELEARNIIKKVYGGVIFNHKETAIPLQQRQISMKDEKLAMAARAAEFVNDGDIIILDAGSTTVHIIEHLRQTQQVTIITNSVPVVNAALPYDNLHVIITGGDLLRSTNSLVGQEGVEMLRKFNAHTVFLAATSLSLEKGLTNSLTVETEIKKTMMQVSEQVILLVDHTKFETVSLVKFADLNQVDAIVTDKMPPESYFHYCHKHGKDIIVSGT